MILGDVFFISFLMNNKKNVLKKSVKMYRSKYKNNMLHKKEGFAIFEVVWNHGEYEWNMNKRL